MKTNRVWAVYFTGTQTTSKVVEKLADELAGRLGCDRLTYDPTCFSNILQTSEETERWECL